MSDWETNWARWNHLDDPVFRAEERESSRRRAMELPVRKTEVDLYASEMSSPDYVRNASGLQMPTSIERAAEMARQTPYLLIHHYASCLTIAEERWTDHRQRMTFLEAAQELRNKLLNKDTGIFGGVPLNRRNLMHPQVRALQLTGLDHSYTEDVDGDSEPALQIADAFIEGMLEQGKVVLGINNSLDPFCTALNLTAIGNHCHLQWLDSQHDIDSIDPVWQSDAARLLAPVRWYVFTQLAARYPELEERNSFLKDFYNGRISLYLDRAQIMGAELEIPEVHIQLDAHQLVDQSARFHFTQFTFNPVGLTNAFSGKRLSHPDIYALAADIEQSVTLNNFQQYIAEY